MDSSMLTNRRQSGISLSKVKRKVSEKFQIDKTNLLISQTTYMTVVGQTFEANGSINTLSFMCIFIVCRLNFV